MIGRDNETQGFTEATELIMASGGISSVNARSVLASGTCSDLTAANLTYCMLSLAPTTIIPTAFATPITIVEE